MDYRDSGLFRLASVVDASSAITDEMSLKERSNLIFLDRCLHELWGLGQNVILNWCPDGDGITLIVIPHYGVAAYSSSPQIGPVRPGSDGDLRPKQDFFQTLLSARRCLTRSQLIKVSRLLNVETTHLALREPLKNNAGQNELIEQLNSLSYSLNSAQAKLLTKRIGVDFSRTTTGDGFYIWNRNLSLEGNVSLYHFMQLVLADNAIAHKKAEHNTVPRLRASFHVGSSYEFHQAEGLNPTIYNFIVGDVTVELARIIERALPGQIFIGDFRATMQAGGPESSSVTLDSVAFVDMATRTVGQLAGIELSGERVDAIRSYLTGPKLDNGEFTVRRLVISDKHGMTRRVYNAKVNIYRHNAEPILLGIEDRVLDPVVPPPPGGELRPAHA
jgi:hypothetical protein